MTGFIDMYDNHPSGFWDTANDCDGRCIERGVPCRDCEAEQVADHIDDYEPDGVA